MVGWVSKLRAVTLCLPLASCGGASRHSAADDVGGAAGNGGTSALGAAAGAPDGGQPPETKIDGFESPAFMAAIGLWMGFDGTQLPTGLPPVAHDGSALHLVGKTDDAGLDVFYHTGLPVERIWSRVRFWSQSDVTQSRLTVAIGGPEPLFFRDRAQGIDWPAQRVELSPAWQETVVDFSRLGIGPDQLSPHSEMFGAVHFIIEPNTAYDLWIDDFAGQPLYR